MKNISILLNKNIKLIELFSGIGGFAFGLKEAGFNITKHQFSEVDKHAIANYKYNFKNAEYIGSVTDVRGQRNQADIITFGSPCQDFSVSGKGKGLTGERSSLILEAIRLVSEIKPSVFIWENVKGTFSSNNGADFWAILNAFTNIGGYRLEWQLLNTSWFLPQNRERIYLIGHLAGKSTPKVFPFTENDRLFNQAYQSKRRRFQTQVSTTLGTKIRSDSTFIIPKKAACLTAGGNSGGLHSDITVIPVLTPNRKEKHQNGRSFKTNGEPAFTLNCQDQQGVLIKANTLDTQCNQGVLDGSKIRRLTEIEWERLQGYPDNWTQFGIYEKQVWINKKEGTFKIVEGVKEIPQTQRYKLNGNAVTTAVVKAIGKRLLNHNLK